MINTARGEIIIDYELVDVLQTRPDLTYATDVLAGEAEGKHITSRLLDLNNVIFTPHIGSLTVEYGERVVHIIEKLVWEWHYVNYEEKRV